MARRTSGWSTAVRLTHRTPGEPKLGTPTWTRAHPPIVVTLIHGGEVTLGALQADGSLTWELEDTDGDTFDGAHPRVWVEP